MGLWMEALLQKPAELTSMSPESSRAQWRSGLWPYSPKPKVTWSCLFLYIAPDIQPSACSHQLPSLWPLRRGLKESGAKVVELSWVESRGWCGGSVWRLGRGGELSSSIEVLAIGGGTAAG